MHSTTWQVQNPTWEIHDHHQGCQEIHIVLCDSNPTSSWLIILEPHKTLHWGSLFCKVQSIFC